MVQALQAHTELRVTQCGTEQCRPGHQFGPFVRDCYLIHYIFSGSGTYHYDGRQYHLHEGQGFLIFPDEVTIYRASEQTPWHYGWIGYTGETAAALTQKAGLTKASPTFTLKTPKEARATLEQVILDVSKLRLGETAAVGGLLRLLALTGETRCSVDEKEPSSILRQYFQKAVWYIEGNLFSPVRVSDVANFVGLCRSQLFRVFQEAAGCSPQQWIQEARLRRAEAS